LPAVAAAVIRHDDIAAIGVAGVRRSGGAEPAELDDRWHLGSCTKAMTATMIGALVEQGVLSWDTTVAEALPELVDNMRAEYRDVTIEMLLAHRGGINGDLDVPGLWPVLWKREGTPVEQRRRMAAAMLFWPPKVPPGEYYYANCGYGIAGHMAETVTGKPWEELMRELVFEPLGMHSAGFGVPWEGEPATDPWPHAQDGTAITPGPMADNPPAIGPGGTVHASIRDWAKFVAEHLRGARGEDGQLLKAKTYARLHRGQPTGTGDPEYALGWSVTHRDWARGADAGDVGRCLNHAGSNNSWFSVVWIAPEADFAVLCVTNIGGEGVFPRLDAVVSRVIRDHQVADAAR
ncbi:MAG: beta-lactamase family protein, partial [Phycisphaerae bacterium]|nr:beta-lactamase family protein [Phycisphaerae bacterium]